MNPLELFSFSRCNEASEFKVKIVLQLHPQTLNLSPQNQSLDIVPFAPKHKRAFFELNQAWLEASFLIEPYDLQVLQHPEEMILRKGGVIFFGLLRGEAIATFALTPVTPGVMELNKMAVREDVQSLGIGQELMRFLIAKCEQMHVHTIELYSHSKLKSAIHIYRKFGFAEIALPDECIYERADIRMRLHLETETTNRP